MVEHAKKKKKLIQYIKKCIRGSFVFAYGTNYAFSFLDRVNIVTAFG